MPKSNAATTAGGMLSDLKSRLGFSHDDERHGFDDFDEYDDFDDDGFNARDDREFAGYGADYNENAPVGGFKPATTRSSRFGRPDSTPDLVTINDVKARTTVPDDLLRDPLASTGDLRATRRPNDRDLVEPSGSLHSASQGQASSLRSEGLNSLFEPTASSGSFDPYAAYSGTGATSFSSKRKLTVIRPMAYGDVEQVARALKAGDVVVLAMRSTPDDLSKRVLDFSFGVASALDANVECPGEKVFAIARGNALTADEKQSLGSQGVL